MGSDDWVHFKINEMSDLPKIKKLKFEDLPIENFKNLNLSTTLPNLENLIICNCPLKSLKGLPEMPNLISIRMRDLANLHTFKGLPVNLPNLRAIYLQDLANLHTFKGLPVDLPKYTLKIKDVNIITFQDLPENIESLEIENRKKKFQPIFDLNIKNPMKSGFFIENCIIKDFSYLSNHSIKDLKEYGVGGFNDCVIHSFEGFPDFPENTNFNDIFDRFNEVYKVMWPSLLLLGHTQIRSLSGLPLNFLHYFLPHIAITNREFDFAPYGLKLFENCIDREYLRQAQANSRENLISTNTYRDEIEEAQILEEQKQRSFIHENLPPLYEYFKKSTIELAHQYITNPSTMPPALIERLIHEADHNIRKILENSLPPKNPIILKISQKIAFKTQNGFKILK